MTPTDRPGPKRIQLSRRKGYRKPEGAIVVSRPSRWGNPFAVKPCVGPCGPTGRHWHYYDPDAGALSVSLPTREQAIDESVRHFREGVLDNDSDRYTYLPRVDQIRDELAGRDLACWCRPGDQCHGDDLLSIANPPLAESFGVQPSREGQ